MRDIKFRGQRIDSDELVYGDLIHGVGHKKGKMYILPLATNLAYLPGCDALDGYEVRPETIGEFTGLLDKNGVEIFEGDVVKSDYYTGTVGEFKRIIAVVKYHRCSFMMEGINKYEGLRKELHTNSEVLGNLYQHPNLLK